MDINIIAPGHPSQEKMKEFYENKLLKKFGKKQFLTSAEVHVKLDEYGDYEVTIRLTPIRGADMYAKESNMKEQNALSGAIKKLHPQIEKYEGTHFRSER